VGATIASTMMEQPLVLASVLCHAELYHGGRQIHSRSADGVVSVTTYGELADRARRLAGGLSSLGIGPGDRVGTFALNSARHVEVYFAAAGMGAVYHTLNPRLTVDQAAYIVGHAEDKVLFFDPHLAPLVATFRPAMPGVRHWIALGPDAIDAGGATIASEDLLAGGPPGFDWPDIDERAAAALCYTSGTTGNPRGVLYSHRALVVQALAACLPDAENISARDTILVVVPMFHVNGWGLPYSGAITGAGLVLPGPRVDGASLVDLMARCDVTLGAAVPTIWQVDLAISQGRPMFPLQIRIVDPDGAPLPHDGSTTGEVQIRGLWITGRYYRGDSAATAGGWLPTGDIASIDADGYLRLSDRAKDLISRAANGSAPPPWRERFSITPPSARRPSSALPIRGGASVPSSSPSSSRRRASRRSRNCVTWSPGATRAGGRRTGWNG
jgi:acyl-CoA synthetase (AMP-forming)/AMP-acid ligase II